MPSESAPVLVSGATGKQGGATVRALLASGVPVRALVRDPNTARAETVATLGAELVTGDLDDRDSVTRAARGARAVFSVQMPDFTARGFEGELTQGVNLIEAAKAAGVPQFIYTAVSGVANYTESPGWAEGRWDILEASLSTKDAIQKRVREAGFTHWTIIRPSTFMENFLPSEAYLLPRGVAGGLVSLLKPGTPVALVAVDDIGKAAAAAVGEPERFHRVELELASDFLTMTEIAEILSRNLGSELAAPDMTAEEAMAAGMPPAGIGLDWMNVAVQPARPQYARALGISVTSFADWARRHLPESA
ncbi:NmrA/HSCARG family protein [Rhodococcus sp. UFZ-B548]|uniref:NmrA/HSCARG family protein n=1 Tax=Rhodococcus sp. UFZ-B548 TaxID=2742212 RepID=UPI0015F47E61|nr:NmrA/HSCARG family protein [Rhodococcus sp. UFZ-B548]